LPRRTNLGSRRQNLRARSVIRLGKSFLPEKSGIRALRLSSSRRAMRATGPRPYCCIGWSSSTIRQFRELRLMEGRSLPDYVEAEFGVYLKCGRLEEAQRRYAADQHKAGFTSYPRWAQFRSTCTRMGTGACSCSRDESKCRAAITRCT